MPARYRPRRNASCRRSCSTSCRKWFLRERGEDVADEVIAFTELCVVVPLDTRLALEAADVAREHGLATADAIIYASARAAGAELVTCDAHFTGLPGVILFPKG